MSFSSRVDTDPYASVGAADLEVKRCKKFMVKMSEARNVTGGSCALQACLSLSFEC